MILVLLVAGCAGSATHEVVADYQASDGSLSCTEIHAEMMKAQAVIDGVNRDKADWTGADVVDGLLWFPFNLIAKDANYGDALKAGSKRIARLTVLAKEKNCATVASQTTDTAKGSGMAEVVVSGRQERQLSGKEITTVYTGTTIDVFQSENSQRMPQLMGKYANG